MNQETGRGAGGATQEGAREPFAAGVDRAVAERPAPSLMNLDQYGAACRCLLRLRENQGLPGISDAAFIARFLPVYPTWHDRPGEADPGRVFEIARALGVGDGGDVVHDYDRVLGEHRAGRPILINTERSPQKAGDDAPRHFTLLLVDMTDADFTLWCPYQSGQSETLPRADRRLWAAWLATALVIHRL